MKVVDSSREQRIAGCKLGETIWVHLISGKAEKIILTDISRLGIEGLEANLSSQPLTFYPFTSIIKIKKFTDIT